jgi:hypothetical protein
MKLLSESERRALDVGDILNLIDAASEADLERARASIDLITARGLARAKDLHARLEHYLAIPRS